MVFLFFLLSSLLLTVSFLSSRLVKMLVELKAYEREHAASRTVAEPLIRVQSLSGVRWARYKRKYAGR